MQEIRLRQLLEYVYKNSPFWVNYFNKRGISSGILQSSDLLHELKRFPIVSRQDLREGGDRIYIDTANEKSPILTRHTSGTSGIPLTIRAREPIYHASHILGLFNALSFNIETARKVLQRRFIVALGTQCGARYTFKEFAHVFHVNFSHVDESTTRRRIYEKIKDEREVVLMGHASLVLRFAQRVVEDRESLPIVGVRIGSEPISLDDRIFLKNTFDVPVANIFAAAEVGYIGFECHENTDRFHLCSERLILEVIDKNGLSTSTGNEGNIVVTALDSFPMPIIRYAIGDTGKISSEECTCGRKSLLFELSGRRNYFVRLPSGKEIKFLSLQLILAERGITRKVNQYQIRQESLNNLTILLVPKPIFLEDDRMVLRVALLEFLKDENISIDIRYVTYIKDGPDGKPINFVPLQA